MYSCPPILQNEMSGAIVPDIGRSRRIRDPRAMRNDYGRLPYHLAMRKGFTWLAELLDPSVPVRCVQPQGTACSLGAHLVLVLTSQGDIMLLRCLAHSLHT